MQPIKCSKCGSDISRNELLVNQLNIEKNLIQMEITKLTKQILLYEEDINNPDVIRLKTLRTTKNEKIKYITNLIRNLQYQMQCEKSNKYEILSIYLIEKLIKSGYTQEHINSIRRLAFNDHKNKINGVKKDIHTIYKKADGILSGNNWYNSSGYFDPTSKLAIDLTYD